MRHWLQRWFLRHDTENTQQKRTRTKRTPANADPFAHRRTLPRRWRDSTGRGGAHFSSPRVQKNTQLENRKANDRCCTRAEVRGARDQQDRQEKRLNLDSGEGNATRTSETARRTHWPERKAN